MASTSAQREGSAWPTKESVRATQGGNCDAAAAGNFVFISGLNGLEIEFKAIISNRLESPLCCGQGPIGASIFYFVFFEASIA